MEGANAIIKVLEGRYNSTRSKRRDQKHVSQSKSWSATDYLIYGSLGSLFFFPSFLGLARRHYPNFMERRGWHEKGYGFLGNRGFVGFIGLGGGGGFGSGGFSGGGFGGGGFGGGGASGGW
jgi:uncharacterized membrane protein YgcG